MTTGTSGAFGDHPAADDVTSRTLFGHPTGLFTLFFAEMWERFSFYGMRALLVLYMTKSFLAYGDKRAYAIYGAYGALVYAAPLIGGMLADRLLGQRRAVIIGGLLMAAGHLMMGVQREIALFVALALLVCGNGFFKPNISTIVGSLYPKNSPKKDGGFTIFYMGINLGAAIAPILCAYVGEKFGWHWGFGLATVGMLIGVAVFAAPTLLTQILIAAGALAVAIGFSWFWDNYLQLFVRLFLSAALLIAAGVAVAALNKGGLPREAGRPPDPAALRRRLAGILRTDAAVYLGIAAAIPLIALLLHRSAVADYAVRILGIAALVYILYDAFVRCSRIERDRVFVILILMIFSLLFWGFFEQAGSSINLFTDRNIDRVQEARAVTQADVGSTLQLRVPAVTGDPKLRDLPLLTQAQLGYPLNGKTFTMTELNRLRELDKAGNLPPQEQVLVWPVTREHVGMGVGGSETPTAEFQAVNPVYILVFGLVFSALWGFLGKRGLDPSTPNKFALALVQLGLGFAALWYGARNADSRGMVAMSWLLLSYLFQTTGELCLSPVGLSMVTKLSPTRMVSTMMGAWFLATAFSHLMAAGIAKWTAVAGEGADERFIPSPIETVNLYGNVYGIVAIASVASAVLCFALVPLLKRWTHEGGEDPAAASAHAVS